MRAPGRITLLSAALVCALGSALPTRAQEVVIAVRVDARPFVWRDPDTDEYLGFFYDLCTKAVERAGYQFREVEVNAENRRAFLRDGVGEFDLLCDPTTITLARMKKFAGTTAVGDLEFSPIIFVANGSFVTQSRDAPAPAGTGCLSAAETEKRPTCSELIERMNAPKQECLSALSAEDTSSDVPPPPVGWLEWIQQRYNFVLRAPPQTRPPKSFQIWGYVTGATIGDAVTNWAAARSDANEVICVRALATHEEAAAEFCAGRLARYFGDVDIVSAAIEAQGERNGADCKADFAHTGPSTYEPYAFVLSSRRVQDFPEQIALALYGMFHDGTVDRLFAGHFPERQKSQHLSTLFRINSIPAGPTAPGPSSTGGR